MDSTESKMDDCLVLAHLVDIDWPMKQVSNPCCEIPLDKSMTLMEPRQITKLRLLGIGVYDLTESLGMDVERVSKSSCYAP